LTAILGMSELLQQKGVQENDRKKALRYLTQAASVLLEMVRDVTDHASLEQRALQLRPAPFALRAAIENCTSLFRPVAEAKGLDIDLDIAPDLPDAVVGDSFRLRQALGNLVSNAVKFTEIGRVRVCVESAGPKPGGLKWAGGKPGAGDTDTLQLRIMVQDTGPGLPKEDAERIFESFQRGSDNPSAPGTGLGLYISRTIARRMGGDVTVTSSPGQGSCFTLELCLQLPRGADQGKNHEDSASQGYKAAADHQGADNAQAGALGAYTGAAPEPVLPAQTPLPQSGPFVGSRILVAEDNEANRYIMEHMLRAEGACVRVARDGKSALAALHEGPWDMVILDARMPDMSGLDVLQAVRSGRAAVSPRQKIIIYTAALDAADRQRCADLEADMVLLKPLTFASLREELASLLPVKESARMPQDCAPAADSALICSSDSPANSAADAPTDFTQEEALMAWNRHEALAALDGDPELLLHLAGVLRSDLQTRDAHLAEALAAGDAHNMRRLAHAVKNSAGTMRFDVLHARAGAAEKAGEADLAQAAAQMRLALHKALATLDAYLDRERGAKVPPRPVVDSGVPTADSGDTAPSGRKGDC
ncbi:MAG: ATP-binding protein, partial [Desulfovibrio sp.]|nr:ATP-binding protein [Desulfovibrio sp.]